MGQWGKLHWPMTPHTVGLFDPWVLFLSHEVGDSLLCR